MSTLTINYTIPFGSSIQIGYQPTVPGNGPYVYLDYYPSYNQSPVTITGIAPALYQVQLTTICQSCCSGGMYSAPIVVYAAGS